MHSFRMGTLSSGTLTLKDVWRVLSKEGGGCQGEVRVERESWIFTGADFAWTDMTGKINVSIHDWLMLRLSVTLLDIEGMNDGYCYWEGVLSVPQLPLA